MVDAPPRKSIASCVVALLACIVACRRDAPAVTHEPASPSPLREASGVVTLPAALEADGRVVVEPARRGSAHDVTSAPCEVVAAPDAQAEVSTTVLARVVAWHVEPGAEVRAGAALVTLDAPVVAQHRAELTRADIDIRELEARVREEQSLHDAGATSERALRESLAALARARVASSSARRALSSAQAPEGGDGGRFTLRAPIDGTVVRRDAVLGAVVEAPHTLVALTNLRALRVAVRLPEQASDVQPGAAATVSFRAHVGTHAARVAWRDAALQRDTRTRLVLLALDDADELLPGHTCTARIESARAGDGVLVPTEAVYREGERATVFVRVAQGRYDARPVVTGREGDGVVELVAGLDVGAPVVVRGTFLVAAAHLQGRGAE